MKIQVSVAGEIREKAPLLELGCIQASVRVEDACAALSDALHAAAHARAEETNLCDERPIRALREFYRALGKDPSRYRGSPEALLRRARARKPMPRISNLVDIINLVSLRTLLPVGIYDRGRIEPPLVFRPGIAGESYRGIGEDEINIAGLPVLVDAIGAFGSPTRDSERAMIRPASTRVLGVIYAVDGDEHIEDALTMLSALLVEHAGARHVEVWRAG